MTAARRRRGPHGSRSRRRRRSPPRSPPLLPVTEVELEEQPDGTPRLVILLPSLELSQLTGGPNTALHLGARVAARGIPVRFAATHGGVEALHGALESHISRLVGRTDRALPVSYESVLGPGRLLRLARSDVLVRPGRAGRRPTAGWRRTRGHVSCYCRAMAEARADIRRHIALVGAGYAGPVGALGLARLSATSSSWSRRIRPDGRAPERSRPVQ